MVKSRDDTDPDAAGDAAIEWFVRLRVGRLSKEEEAAFEAWRVETPENMAAFEEVLHVYGHLAGTNPFRQYRTGLVGKPQTFKASLAAALITTSLALLVWFGDISTLLRANHYAGVGETKTVSLDDGSCIELSPRSAIAIHYTSSRRRLALLKGEAWFQVAPDASRPFDVEASGGVVTALGTAFDIALTEAGARVAVTEHRVHVSSGNANVVVAEGQQSAYDVSSRPTQPSSANLEATTAWRRGKLIVEKMPLGEVLGALGRYRRGFVYCARAETCARRVTGVFGVDDPAQVLKEIELSLDLKAVYLTNYMIILF